jgi:hypothetical protein
MQDQMEDEFHTEWDKSQMRCQRDPGADSRTLKLLEGQ